MGKTIRRANRTNTPKESTKKQKYKINDVYKGITSKDLSDDDFDDHDEYERYHD